MNIAYQHGSSEGFTDLALIHKALIIMPEGQAGKKNKQIIATHTHINQGASTTLHRNGEENLKRWAVTSSQKNDSKGAMGGCLSLGPGGTGSTWHLNTSAVCICVWFSPLSPFLPSSTVLAPVWGRKMPKHSPVLCSLSFLLLSDYICWPLLLNK